MSAPPLTSHLENIEAEDENNMEELSFVSNVVSEPRWALHMCNKCRAKGFEFFQIAAIVCYNENRVKQGVK